MEKLDVCCSNKDLINAVKELQREKNITRAFMFILFLYCVVIGCRLNGWI